MPEADDVQEIEELVSFSRELGATAELVQAAGGNTSIKVGDTLLVKASGQWLADARRESFVEVDLPALRAGLAKAEQEDFSAFCRTGSASALRPSIETPLHAVIPQRVVIHVHSVAAIAWAVRADAEQRLAERLAGVRWRWVPYRRPGLELTRAVEAVLHDKPEVLLLQNHGLLVAAADVAGARALLHEIERRLACPCAVPAPLDRSMLQKLAERWDLQLPVHEQVHQLALDPWQCRLASEGVLYPDHVVFLGAAPLVCRADENRQAATAVFQERFATAPAWYLVPGIGILVARGTLQAVQEMLLCAALVIERIPPETPIRYLEVGEIGELLNWDAEKYRQARAC